MNALLHRALVAVTGQGDELATPPESRLTFAGCRFHSCDEDCEPVCLWTLRETESASDIAPDAYRLIAAPLRSSADEERFLWWRRWSKLIAMTALAGLVALLKFAGCRSL